MNDIQVTCDVCGQEFDVPADQAGRTVKCVRCEAAVAVPFLDAEVSEPTPKLRIKRDTPIGGGPIKTCPQCSTKADADAAICVSCGFDFRTGRKLQEAGKSSHALVLVGVGVLSLLALGVAIWAVTTILGMLGFIGQDETTPAQPPAQEEQAPEPIPVERIEEPEDEPVMEPAPVIEEIPEPEPIDPAVLEEQKRMEEERKRLAEEAAVRRRLTDQLDERFPLYRRGDEVELRQLNGFVHRGTLVSVQGKQALVVFEDLRAVVNVEELDRDSRMRIDPEYRRRMIESRTQHELKGGD